MKHKVVTNVQQNQDSQSEQDYKVIAAGFSRGSHIDLWSYFVNEMMFATLWIAVEGPIDLGSDFNNESRISTDITKSALLTTGHQ